MGSNFMSEGRVLKPSFRSWVGGAGCIGGRPGGFGNRFCLNLGRAEARPCIKPGNRAGDWSEIYWAAAAEVATPSSFSFARARRSSSVPG